MLRSFKNYIVSKEKVIILLFRYFIEKLSINCKKKLLRVFVNQFIYICVNGFVYNISIYNFDINQFLYFFCFNIIVNICILRINDNVLLLC